MSNLKYFLAGVLIMAITSCMQKDSELFLFVGSYADATDPGINLFRFDVEKGTAVPVKSLSGIQDPSYLTVSRDGKFVYSVSETAVPDAKVCAYSFDKQTGTLSLLNEQHTDGSAPCYIWVDSKRRMAVTANYNGGSISVFSISAELCYRLKYMRMKEEDRGPNARRSRICIACTLLRMRTICMPTIWERTGFINTRSLLPIKA